MQRVKLLEEGKLEGGNVKQLTHTGY